MLASSIMMLPHVFASTATVVDIFANLNASNQTYPREAPIK